MTQTETMVKMAFDRWHSLLDSTNGIFNSLTDDQLQKEIAPGRNRGIYLLGHLAAVHDAMLPLLDFGNKLYPELFETFIKSPDKAVTELPPAAELRKAWTTVNEKLAEKFKTMKPEDWFGRHTSVSEEDFKKEPHRNKLNIIITRSTHLAYHEGQLILLK